MIDIPKEVSDDEYLNRRIHPTFVKPDGSLSSQAFRDIEMSVDRAIYRSVKESLLNYKGFGLAKLIAMAARNENLEVIGAQELLNPSHALIIGKKTKSISRRLAKLSEWIISIGEDICDYDAANLIKQTQ